MNTNQEFIYTDRKHGSCWLHKTKPIWIVFYDAVATNPFYEAYTVKNYMLSKFKEGVNPWSLDNERISSGDGFRTLDEAIEAASKYGKD